MSNEVKKTITVGKLTAEKYGKDISSLNLPSVDLSGIQRAMYPILENMRKTFERIQKQQDKHNLISGFSEPSFMIENIKPTSLYQLEEQRNTVDELRKLNEYLAPRNKKKSVIFFNEESKTFIRDTESVSYVCKFSETGMNFKLITTLLDHDGFRQTRNLKKAIGSKTDEAVRKKVQKINEEFANKLRKSSLKLIVGESGAGYKINPGIKIQFL